MREIKFRAWDKINGKIAKVISIDFVHKKIKETYPEISLERLKGKLDNFGEIDFQDVEIMQFTGLKDKNGKEIYEGDIVKAGYNEYEECIEEGKDYVIEFIQGAYCFNEEYPKGLVFDLEDLSIKEDTLIAVEVIGNIYENPELIKK